jgi:hypothetical protein
MPISFDPRSFDPPTQRFLDRIQVIYEDLPRLAAAEWPDYERQLLLLLGQLRQPHVDQELVRVQVLALLGKSQRIHRRWLDTATRGGFNDLTLQGVGGDWLAALLQPAQPVTRYTDLRCPGQVALGREFQVTVRLTLRPHAESRDAQNLSVAPGKPVTVEIDAPAFTVTEGNSRAIAIPDDRDSDWAVFGLKALTGGPAEVRLRFWQGGSYLGQARCDVLVVEHPVTTQTQRQPALPLAFGVGATPPKRILFVHAASGALHFSLYVDGAPVETSLSPMPFDETSARYMRRRYAALDDWAKRSAGDTLDAKKVAGDAEGLGNLLWNDLIPVNLKNLWLDEWNDWAKEPLLVVSDEAHIPWELVWPNEGNVKLPWGVYGPMSRWLGVDALHPIRSGPSERISLTPWAGLFPQDTGISFLAEEAAILRRLLATDGERTPSVPHRQAVLDLLAAGECGWLHASTHGLLDPGGEAEGASLLLEGDERLEPEVLVRTAVRTGLDKSHPGVFWHICHGATGGWSLTGVGGWANRLIGGGASLFLAPQWTITDKAALRFSETFYSQLTAADGTGVAVAVQQARLSAREEAGDPSWLAYALYAHPCATVV